MKEVVVVAAARSAFGKRGGMFKTVEALDLGANTVKGLLERTKLLERTSVDDVYVGSAYPAANAHSHARYLTLESGLPVSVSSTSVEMQCGSSLIAVNNAAYKIAVGMADVIIAGGVESHSRRIVKFPTWLDSYKFVAPAAIPTRYSHKDEDNIPMSKISDLMAEKWSISREESDEFACRSQELMLKGIRTGFTGSEIVPYVIPATRKTPEQVLDKDEFPRETAVENLSRLKPVYADGVTTAGNACGMNDGAAFLLLMSADRAKELGYEPIARWIYGGSTACEPKYMGIGASYALQKALKYTKLTLDDLCVIECNEAFAAQNLSCIRDLESAYGKKLNMDKWNPNGGAISIGHPNGASGARIAYWAIHQMNLTGGHYAAATTCCGGGQGVAAIFENLH